MQCHNTDYGTALTEKLCLCAVKHPIYLSTIAQVKKLVFCISFLSAVY